MTILILGLVIFIGIHTMRIVAPEWRQRLTGTRSEGLWKLAYSAISLLGLVLIVWGFGLARQDPTVVWSPPDWTRHIAVTLNVIAFILLAAYALPAGRIKARLGHPMVLAVKVWAVAHLIANGNLNDMVLFGSLLLWAIVDYAASRRRDRRDGVARTAGSLGNDAAVVAIGLVAALIMVAFLHRWLIGVDPLA